MSPIAFRKPVSSENKINSITKLFEILAKSKPGKYEIAVYRGHSDRSYFLKPSLFRNKEYRKDERSILRELIAVQPNEFREDRSSFEQLVRMQHYGMPTRLLDFTYNPLVGLYFACLDDEKDGEFIQFTLSKNSIKYFDSDTVSCISNLSNLTGRERDQIRSMNLDKDLPATNSGKRLLHFIKSEKPYFLPKIKIDHLKSIVAVRPKQSNRRIIAQQGGFFLFGLISTLIDENNFEIAIKRSRIPAGKKKEIRKELDQINIHGSSLFPEIESAAKHILSKIPAAEDIDMSV